MKIVHEKLNNFFTFLMIFALEAFSFYIIHRQFLAFIDCM